MAELLLNLLPDHADSHFLREKIRFWCVEQGLRGTLCDHTILVATELFANAVTASRGGTVITASVKYEGAGVLVQVVNQGPGFDPEAIPFPIAEPAPWTRPRDRESARPASGRAESWHHCGNRVRRMTGSGHRFNGVVRRMICTHAKSGPAWPLDSSENDPTNAEVAADLANSAEWRPLLPSRREPRSRF